MMAELVGQYAGRLGVALRPQLGPVERAVEALFAAQLERDVEAALAHYTTRMIAQSKGNVLDPDMARELCELYAFSRETRTALTQATHEPASALLRELYRRRISTPDALGLNQVIFLAGGTGAGKTTATEPIILPPRLRRLLANALVVWDATLSNPNSAEDKVRQALEAGHQVLVVYIGRECGEAWRYGVVPRAVSEGRVVTVHNHIASHQGSLATVRQLSNLFGTHPRFAVTVVDNSGGRGEARLTDMTALEAWAITHPDRVALALTVDLERRRTAGNLPDDMFQALS